MWHVIERTSKNAAEPVAAMADAYRLDGRVDAHVAYWPDVHGAFLGGPAAALFNFSIFQGKFSGGADRDHHAASQETCAMVDGRRACGIRGSRPATPVPMPRCVSGTPTLILHEVLTRR